MKQGQKNYFKSNLLFLLEKHKLTPTQLAREIDISKQAVSSWIKEDSNISIQHGIDLAGFFSISLDVLFLYDLRAAQALNNLAEIDIFSNSDIPFIALDIFGKGNYCNPAMAELLRYNREELISRHSYELVHPFDMQRYRAEMKKLKRGEAEFVLLDLKYLLGSGEFKWIRQFSINSPKDERIYIFAFPYSDSNHPAVPLKKEKFFVETIALQELNDCISKTLFPIKMEIINALNPDLAISVDQNVFQCLIRSMFYQMLLIDSETDKRVVKFSSRKEGSDVIMSAIINCKLNATPMDLRRLKTVAEMVDATVEETLAGNLYCLTYTFHKQ